MFVVLLTYVRPLEEVDAAMKAHMSFLRARYKDGTFIVSGRRIPRSGGVILARASDRKALTAIMDQDPFVARGLATYEIVEFRASQYDPAFAVFVGEE